MPEILDFECENGWIVFFNEVQSYVQSYYNHCITFDPFPFT